MGIREEANKVVVAQAYASKPKQYELRCMKGLVIHASQIKQIVAMPGKNKFFSLEDHSSELRMLTGDDLDVVRTFQLPERSSESARSYICACAYDAVTDLLVFSSVDHQVYMYEAEGRTNLLHSFEDPFRMFYNVWYLPMSNYWVFAYEAPVNTAGTMHAHMLTVYSIKKKIGVTIKVRL